jgi:hypothetical protein
VARKSQQTTFAVSAGDEEKMNSSKGGEGNGVPVRRMVLKADLNP